MIYVVSAAIICIFDDAPKILLTQRSGCVKFPWAWCTPGGKVKQDESFEDALVRGPTNSFGKCNWYGPVCRIAARYPRFSRRRQAKTRGFIELS